MVNGNGTDIGAAKTAAEPRDAWNIFLEIEGVRGDMRIASEIAMDELCLHA